MLRRSVPLVARKAVHRIFAVERDQHRVARRFRDDRCRRDRRHVAVALDDCIDGTDELRTVVTVDERLDRLDGQRLDGAAHREQRRAQYVHRVDLADVACRNRPRDCLCTNADCDFLPLLGRHHLRIAQAANATLGVENDGRGDDGSRERAASCFVDARDQHGPSAAESVMPRARPSPGHPSHGRARPARRRPPPPPCPAPVHRSSSQTASRSGGG